MAYLLSLNSDGSRKTMRRHLDAAVELFGVTSCLQFPWQDLTVGHVQLIRAKFQSRVSFTTANCVLAAVKGVAKQAWLLNLIDADTLLKIKAVKAIPGARVTRGRHLEPEELASLFKTCDDGIAGARDLAILTLLAAGLRRAEVAAVQLEDLQGDRILVKGKGNKERYVYLPPRGQLHIDAWLRQRTKRPGPLLVALKPNGQALDWDAPPVSGSLVRNVYVARAKQAGIQGDTSTHDMRRTFCGRLFNAGVDVSTIQSLMGHASLVTTQKYDRRGEDRKRAAARKLEEM